jgi:hypothetical protein
MRGNDFSLPAIQRPLSRAERPDAQSSNLDSGRYGAARIKPAFDHAAQHRALADRVLELKGMAFSEAFEKARAHKD